MATDPPTDPQRAANSNDWLKNIRARTSGNDAELNIADLQPGDRLLIVTRRTRYEFLIVSGRDAELKTDRADRPVGKVSIMGCTFSGSHTIKPGQIFCGGHLEFTCQNGTPTPTPTTATTTYLTGHIREISTLRRTGKS